MSSEFLNGCFHFSFNLPEFPSIAFGFGVNSKCLYGHPGLSIRKLRNRAQVFAFLTCEADAAQGPHHENLGLKKGKGDIPQAWMTSKLAQAAFRSRLKAPPGRSSGQLLKGVPEEGLDAACPSRVEVPGRVEVSRLFLHICKSTTKQVACDYLQVPRKLPRMLWRAIFNIFQIQNVDSYVLISLRSNGK